MKKYEGSCHCGAVRFEVTTDLAQVITCNCSHCARKGLVLTFVDPEQFTLISGEDNLTDYQFNKKKIHHLSCRTCSVQPFGRGTAKDGSPRVAINVRCFEDFDLGSISPTPVDGKSF